MSITDWLQYTSLVSLFVFLGVLFVMWRQKLFATFRYVAIFVSLDCLNEMISIPLLFFRRATHIPLDIAYAIYFYSHWSLFILQSVVLLGVIYSVFHLAMKPLKGLHKLGTTVFRWITGASTLFAICIVATPHLLMAGIARDHATSALSGEVQQGLSILCLCLLVFVCFAVKPLGLTFRSRIFGVSLGLGLYAVVQLVQSFLTAFGEVRSLYSPIFLFAAIGSLLTYLVWAVYFILPEPKRGMIMLPTTSPYFFWNKISEILGDPTGHVVVAGFTPDMMAPGELQVAHAMSRAEAERKGRRQIASSQPFLDEYDTIAVS